MHPEAQFTIESDATCIIVCEKEGVYTRLSEDKFFQSIPSILVTGKGFPDIATRALVFVLWKLLKIPVYGLADCNPFGLAVLQTYFRGGKRNQVDGGERYHVPIQWVGLRPSQFKGTHGIQGLPREVHQKLTELDKKKIKSLVQDATNDSFMNGSRRMELELMRENGWKCELESLHWLGMDYMSRWLEEIVNVNVNVNVEERRAGRFVEDGDCENYDDGSDGSDDEFDPRIAI